MGYETTIIVGREVTEYTTALATEAVLELGKVEEGSATADALYESCAAAAQGQGRYFATWWRSEDDDTERDTDMYGDRLPEILIPDLIRALEVDVVSDPGRRRYRVALAALRAFDSDPCWHDGRAPLRAIQFGH